ncbi:MAG: 3-phosphoshikimate 1-carboxyvinyltransferase [Planctomycetes bacterium GWF2_50_10]|nr:MAG: 3-phosphoshikimate 1-carboxyvinyltransferase [Planctomycetes bacterium GWF2_50_10]
MLLKVRKSRLCGKVEIPASKSHTIRAVAIASLASGTSYIRKPLISYDAISAVKCYGAMGADINTDNDQCWVICGNGGQVVAPKEVIDVGNSGTTMRLATGSAALCRDLSKIIRLTGDEQIQNRPIAPLLTSLSDLGANAYSVKGNGKAPVEVRGRLRGGKTSINCFTSQYLSSLLLCTPLGDGDTEIDVPLLNEPDYVKITCDWLDWQGIRYQNDSLRHLQVPGGQGFKAFDMAIPADFSSATFFMVAAAILGADIEMEGLDFRDSQPDKAVAGYLADMGCPVIRGGTGVGKRTLRVVGKSLKGIEIDMNGTPDALPAMAVVGAFAEGETRLVNVPQARSKETDRIACMAKELSKMGADIEELADGLVIRKSKLHAARVDGHWDHRIVMALSLAGMAVEGETIIDTAEAMNVTFPNFVELMRSLGGELEVEAGC